MMLRVERTYPDGSRNVDILYSPTNDVAALGQALATRLPTPSLRRPSNWFNGGFEMKVTLVTDPVVVE